MSTVEITKHMAEKPARSTSKFVGAYYLLTILTGAFLLFFHGRLAFAVDLFVGVFYLVVTAFLYGVSGSRDKTTTRLG
jgi:hypoxanthine-guanine phosphoribosyltransferase